MGGIATLRSFSELDEGHAVEAGLSREKFCAFVERLASIARPGDEATPLLVALGRVVETSHWMEGSFQIEITGDDCDSAVGAYVDDGAVRERLIAPTTLPIPFDLFVDTIASQPEVVARLRVEKKRGGLVLTAPSSSSSVVRAYEIDEQSLGVSSRTTSPPPASFDARRTTAAAEDPKSRP